MNEYLQYLDQWRVSQAKKIAAEGYSLRISTESAHKKSSRYLDIESSRFIARATIWESGELELEAIARDDGRDIVRKTLEVSGTADLDDKLNWWLSELLSIDGDL